MNGWQRVIIRHGNTLVTQYIGLLTFNRSVGRNPVSITFTQRTLPSPWACLNFSKYLRAYTAIRLRRWTLAESFSSECLLVSDVFDWAGVNRAESVEVRNRNRKWRHVGRPVKTGSRRLVHCRLFWRLSLRMSLPLWGIHDTTLGNEVYHFK